MSHPFPALDGSSPKVQQFDSAPDMGIDPSKRYTATMETSMGTLVIALDALNAPITVNNFVFLAGYHYYEGVIFHRIIDGFMCQGGDPTGTGRGGTGYRFVDEQVKQRYQLGSMAMANAGPNTNGSQFFLTYVATPWLNGKHSIFGKVESGMDVLKQISERDPSAGTQPGDKILSIAIEEK
jgi:peptidylprolyl isomerase